jgi:hypothetical protein
MNVPKWISPLYWIAAVYDGALGLLFLGAPWWAFERFNVTPPNHMAYVQFPAALLIIFALIFAAIARNPVAKRELMVYGILLKIAYCSISSYYWLTTDIPIIWKPFVFADLAMGVLFVVAYLTVTARPETRAM